jgi:lycopene beta-cyclase
MISNNVSNNKKVLIIEPNEKNTNDRTWCYWEKENGNWDNILKKKWVSAHFTTKNTQKIDCFNNKYSYKMIESKTFYKEIIQKLKQHPNIIWKKEKVIGIEEQKNFVSIQTKNNTYKGDYLFNSVLNHTDFENNPNYPLVQQHFIGWFIKTNKPEFNNEEASFMDFSVPQNNNTRFMYVLPTSPTEALIEYTLFSPNILPQEEYENAIKDYLKQKEIIDYEIVTTEKGNIPMSVYPFWQKNTDRILNIGTAGGWTKASTGYTFKNSSKKAKEVVSFLNQDTIDFRKFHKKNRFLFYDTLFISVLHNNNSIGQDLFTNMFTKVAPEKILRFLDEESSFWEELQIIWACPKKPFIKALLKYIFRQ